MEVFYNDTLDEVEAQKLMSNIIFIARDTISNIHAAFKSPWEKNPSTGERAVFGHWVVKAVRHLSSITILCENHDLSMVAHVHHRQIFEIFLQVRYFASVSDEEREYLSQKIAALGCVEYLEKLKSIKDHEIIKDS